MVSTTLAWFFGIFTIVTGIVVGVIVGMVLGDVVMYTIVGTIFAALMVLIGYIVFTQMQNTSSNVNTEVEV
jgi:uncharacterized membrane protein